MRLPHDGLVETVVRYVRSGKWKELKSGKDRSIYDYLCKNLERREQMLARIRINKELGDETPEELAVTKKQGQQHYRVKHTPTGAEGVVVDFQDDQAIVSWVGDQDQSAVGYDELQFFDQVKPPAIQYPIGTKVRLYEGEKTGTVRDHDYTYHSEGLLESDAPDVSYLIEWDDLTPPTIHPAPEIRPVWRKDRYTALRSYFEAGDKVVDTRYNMLVQVENVNENSLVILPPPYARPDHARDHWKVTYTDDNVRYLKKVDDNANPRDYADSLPSHWPDGVIAGGVQYGSPNLGDNGKIVYPKIKLRESVERPREDYSISSDNLAMKTNQFSHLKDGKYVVRNMRPYDYRPLNQQNYTRDEMFGRSLGTYQEGSDVSIQVQMANGEVTEEPSANWRLANDKELIDIKKWFENVEEVQPQHSEYDVGDWFKNQDGVFRVEKVLSDGRLYGIDPSKSRIPSYDHVTVNPEDVERVTEEHEFSWMSPGNYIYNSVSRAFEKIIEIQTNFIVTEIYAPGTDIDGQRSGADQFQANEVTPVTSEQIRQTWEKAKFDVGDSVIGSTDGSKIYTGKIMNDKLAVKTDEFEPAYLFQPTHKRSPEIISQEKSKLMKADDLFSTYVYTENGETKPVVGEVDFQANETRADYDMVVPIAGDDDEVEYKNVNDVEPLISDFVDQLGGLEQYMDKFITTSGVRSKYRTEPGTATKTLYDSVTGYLTDAKINTHLNTVDVQVEGTAGRDVKRLSLPWKEFYELIYRARDSRDVRYQSLIESDDELSLVDDKQYLEYSPNSKIPTNYMPDESGQLPIVKFLDFLDDTADEGERYEATIASNLDMAAKSFDSVLYQNAMRDGDVYLLLRKALENGHIDKEDSMELSDKLRLARNKMFNNLNSRILVELYNRSSMKAQFASALDYNIKESVDYRYMNDVFPTKAKVSAYQEILQNPETYGFMKNISKINDLGLLEFNKLLRIRRGPNGEYKNTNIRSLTGTMVAAASTVKQGMALKHIADTIPGDMKPPAKLKALINTMLGYEIDENGELAIDEEGQAIEARDEQGRSLKPTAKDLKDNKGEDNEVTERLGDALRRISLSFDDEGQSINYRIEMLSEKHGLSKDNLSGFITSLMETEASKGYFEPSIFRALEDDEFGKPLKNIAAEATQSSPDEIWKAFTSGPSSVPGDVLSRAFIDGHINYEQAVWLGSSNFEKSLVDQVVADTGMTVTDLAMKIINGEGVGGEAFQQVITPDKMRQMLATSSMINSISWEAMKDAIEQGLFDDITFSDQSKRSENFRKAVEFYSKPVIDHIIEHGLEKADEITSSIIKQPQILEEVKKHWRDNINPSVMNELSAMHLPYEERNEKLKVFRDMLMVKHDHYPDQYAWVQEANHRLMPMNRFFAPDGEMHRGIFNSPDIEEIQALDSIFESYVTGVSGPEMQYRVRAGEAGKNIGRAAKQALDLMHDALGDDHQKQAMNAMYLAFTGDIKGKGRGNNALAAIYSQLSENGFASDEALGNFADVMDWNGVPLSTTDFPYGASGVVEATVAKWMQQSSEDEVQKMYKSITPESIAKIEAALEQELLQQSIDSIKSKFSAPKKGESGKPIMGDDGKPELEVQLSSFKNLKQLEKKFKKSGMPLDGEETFLSKVNKVLDEVGVEPDYAKFKGDEKAEFKILSDQLMRLEQNESAMDDFFMKMFTPSVAGDQSIFAAISEIKNLAEKNADDVEDMRSQIANMMTAMFVSSIIPPRSESHQDGIGGYWPYNVKITKQKRGSVTDMLGAEWTFEHNIDWKSFFENFDHNFAHLGEDEREHKKKIFEEMKALDLSRGHSMAPWVIVEVGNVDYVDDDGSERSSKKLLTREIQYDGIQKYLSDVEHPKKASSIADGEQVAVYDQAQIEENIKRYDELEEKRLSLPPDGDGRKEIEDEMWELRRPPKMKVVTLRRDPSRGGERYYEEDGVKHVLTEVNHNYNQAYEQEVYVSGRSSAAFMPSDYKKRSAEIQRKLPNQFETEVMNEMTKVYNLVYRSLVRAGKAIGADEVLVLPSWTAKMKPKLLNWVNQEPPVDTAIRDAFSIASPEKIDGKQVKDYLGNDIWRADKVSQPLKNGYDNTARAWGFTLEDLDHYYATDPFWSYGRQMTVSQMWKMDITGENKKSQEQLKRLNKRDAKRRRGLITAQHSEAGASLAAFLKTYFEIQYRSGEIDFNRFAETLRDGYIQWRDLAAHQHYVRDPQVLEDAKRVASANLGIDLTGIDSPEWSYQQIDQEAYDKLLEQAQAPIEGSDDRPDPAELAAKLDSVLESIMPNMYSHPEYSHLDSLDVPTAVARDVLMHDHVNFPQSAVREDPIYCREILDRVTAFEIRHDEVTDTGTETTWQDVVPDDGGIAGGNVSQANFYASEAVSYMNSERDDSYDAFVRWIDAEAPELHSNDALRAEVEQELRDRGKFSRVTTETQVPSADELNQMFGNDVREASSDFNKGDKVVVRYCVVPDIRCQALARKQAAAKVHAVTKAGYVLEFENHYDQKVLNRQLWLFTDLHLQPASGVSNGQVT